MSRLTYVSTRGSAPELGFADVLLAGLALDGGLYVPGEWPPFAPGSLAGFVDRPYAEVATEVMWPFVEGSIGQGDFASTYKEGGQSYPGFQATDAGTHPFIVAIPCAVRRAR